MKPAFVKSMAAAIAGGVFAFTATAGGVPSIGEVTVTEVGDNYVTFSAVVSGLGDGATKATVSFAYGVTASALNRTQQVGEVTDTGTLSLKLTRLRPNTAYYAALVIENSNDIIAKGETIALHTATSLDAAPASQVGLNQTFFTSANAIWTKDYTTLPAGTDWTHYTDDDRVYRRELGTIMAYVGGNPKSMKYTSEVWGDEVYWPVSGGQWAYWGYIYLEKGKNYKFRAYIDDAERVMVTNIATGEDVVLLVDTGWSSLDTSKEDFGPTMSGWYPLEVRISDGDGGLGGRDNSNNYKNPNNMGYSSDGGVTWNLLLDHGDGSLLRIGCVDDIAVSESVSGGTLSLSLSFAASESARTLAAVWGPAHGGNDSTNGWAFAAVVGEVAASETSVILAPPAGWGSDDCLVLRYCFIDADGNILGWSPSTYWRDLSEPRVTDLATDGSGGDTLVVTGYASVPSDACTVQVYVGTSLDAMSAWPDASKEMTTSGDFSFTLFTDDLESERLLKPGETYYVAVSAKTSGGVAVMSETAEVTMTSALVFDPVKSSLDHRKMTVSGTLLNICGKSPVSLWVGESNDASKMKQVGDAQTVSADGDGNFEFTCNLDSFYKGYHWQLRADRISLRLTATNTTTSTVSYVCPRDSTTYTMKDGVNGNWDDAANWDNNAGGDCIGYPDSTDATASFAANRKGRLLLTTRRTINKLDVTGANADVTLAQGGSDTNATQLSCNDFAVSGQGCRLTLDGVAFTPERTDKPTLGKYSTLSLTNGACIFKTFTTFNSQQLGTVEVASGSWLGMRFFDFGPCTIVVNDATLCIAGSTATESAGMEAFGGGVALGTNAVFRFLGKKPQLLFGGPLPWLASHQDKVAFTFEFEVPAGGYESAPIRATNPNDDFTRKFGAGHLEESSTMPEGVVNGFARVVVSTNSPALKSSKTLTATPLISWPKGGISLDFVKEFEVPDKGNRGNAFVWGDYLESDSTVPQTLGVTLVGRGMVMILR